MAVLLVKAAADGSLGDCPFAHYSRMCLALAEKPYKVQPTKREDKPEWHLNDHGGSMPCWCPEWPEGSGAISDSAQIARMALPPTEADEAVLATAGEAKVFPSIAKYIKNTDDAEDAALREGLDAALGALDKTLSAAGTPFFSGSSPGHADAWIATKLYVLDVAGGHYKKFAIDADALKTLAEYKARVFAHSAFTSTAYPPAEAIVGWGEARGGGH